jgi:hypothetical protein
MPLGMAFFFSAGPIGGKCMFRGKAGNGCPMDA